MLTAYRPGERVDADEGRKALDTVQLHYLASTPDRTARVIAARAAHEVDRFASGQVQSQLRSAIGVDVITKREGLPDDKVKAFTAENVKLIKSIPDRYFEQVGALVTVAEHEGTRAGDLAGQIEERFGVASSSAKLVARDQINKFNGEVTRTRQAEAGITSYTWRTSRDERVRGDPTGKYPNVPDRKSHYLLEGKVFQWDDPPPVGHPGEDIQCRCRAEPNIEELLAGL